MLSVKEGSYDGSKFRRKVGSVCVRLNYVCRTATNQCVHYQLFCLLMSHLTDE